MSWVDTPLYLTIFVQMTELPKAASILFALFIDWYSVCTGSLGTKDLYEDADWLVDMYIHIQKEMCPPILTSEGIVS